MRTINLSLFNIFFNFILIIFISLLLVNYNLYTLNYSFFLYPGIFLIVDNINIVFLMLCGIVFIFCSIYNYSNITFSKEFNSILLFIIEVLLLLSFLVNNLFLFFIFFEALLLPLFLLIGFFGGRGKKVHAAFLLLFFTLFSSILILIGIFYIYIKIGSLNFNELYLAEFTNFEKFFISFLFFFGFMSKIPMLPLHIWLPEAHVEAPTVGSVILAAVLLKLGFYGLLRIFEILFGNDVSCSSLRCCIVIICLFSIFFCSCLAIRQIDLKKIVAYSSIVHMSFGLLGILGVFETGIYGSIFIMFSHGLISAAMFFSVGILYDRFHVRNIMYYGGLVQFMPVFGILFFFLLFSNMSFPGTCNFIGEFLVFVSIFNNFGILILLLCSIFTIFTAVFCLLVFNKVLFYQITGFISSNLKDITIYEFFILFFFDLLILIYGLLPNLLLGLLC